jgi:phage gpG-like protein
MGKTLMLAGSMRQTATETEAILGMGRGVPYAAIHNFGGAIKHPGSNKLQSFRIGGKWITTTHTRPHLIPMPKRQYMMFQEGDETRYAEMIRAYIMDFGMNNKTVVP